MEKILNQIKTCLYIIISLLVILIITLIVVNGDAKTTATDDNSDYDVSMFDSIDATKFLSIASNDQPTVVYLGREGCSYCVKFLPTLQKAQTQLGYKTQYIDISNIETSSDNYNKMLTMINNLTDKFNSDNGTEYESIYGYTPMVLIVQNGEIKDVWIGYNEYDKFVEFLNENGVK